MGYDRQIAAIQSAIDRLTVLTGIVPRVTEEGGAIVIETDVAGTAADQWQSLLDVLDQGTSYGLTDTAAGQKAWLRFDLEEGSR